MMHALTCRSVRILATQTSVTTKIIISRCFPGAILSELEGSQWFISSAEVKSGGALPRLPHMPSCRVKAMQKQCLNLS
jgi:hypothetical protein